MHTDFNNKQENLLDHTNFHILEIKYIDECDVK